MVVVNNKEYQLILGSAFHILLPKQNELVLVICMLHYTIAVKMNVLPKKLVQRSLTKPSKCESGHTEKTKRSPRKGLFQLLNISNFITCRD